MKYIWIAVAIMITFSLGVGYDHMLMSEKLSDQQDQFQQTRALLGQPIKYSEICHVSCAHSTYRVISVVDQYDGTAVVRVLPYRSENNPYILVTGMTQDMMRKDYTFRIDGREW